MSPSDDDNERTEVIGAEQETLVEEIKRAKEHDSCLIIIRGKPQGQRFFLTDQEMTIGRDPGADITLTDPSISRKHGKLTKEKGGKVRFTDLGSANGTLVNGVKLSSGESVLLAKEDMVKMGHTVLKFLPAGEIEILFYGQLNSAAHTDSLTGIYNKRYLQEALGAEFKRAKALQGKLTCIYFDLDYFKNVNDSHGHDAGDYVLREFTTVIRSRFIRKNDVFARYGGEEFVILLGNTDLDQGFNIAEDIRQTIESHKFIYEGTELPVTMSAGIASVTEDIQTANDLIKTADKALYHAKETGRNKVVSIKQLDS